MHILKQHSFFLTNYIEIIIYIIEKEQKAETLVSFQLNWFWVGDQEYLFYWWGSEDNYPWRQLRWLWCLCQQLSRSSCCHSPVTIDVHFWQDGEHAELFSNSQCNHWFYLSRFPLPIQTSIVSHWRHLSHLTKKGGINHDLVHSRLKGFW